MSVIVSPICELTLSDQTFSVTYHGHETVHHQPFEWHCLSSPSDENWRGSCITWTLL